MAPFRGLPHATGSTGGCDWVCCTTGYRLLTADYCLLALFATATSLKKGTWRSLVRSRRYVVAATCAGDRTFVRDVSRCLYVVQKSKTREKFFSTRPARPAGRKKIAQPFVAGKQRQGTRLVLAGTKEPPRRVCSLSPLRGLADRRGDKVTPVTSSCPPILLLAQRERCSGVWGWSPQDHPKIRHRRVQFERPKRNR
jgi:hypothetical protein